MEKSRSPKKVSLGDLKDGTVGRLRPAQFAKLVNKSLVTVYREIKSGRVDAIKDPVTGRIFIPAAAALAYLAGEPYKHDFQDTAAQQRMETARAAKSRRS